MTQSRVVWLAGNGRFEFEIRGESHYQQHLELLSGGRTVEGADHDCFAMLVPEPDNLFDPGAVRVELCDAAMERSYPVGYLARHINLEYTIRLAGLGHDEQIAWCRAKIVGGWEDHRSSGHFGVKLDLLWPVELAE
jgi:hypothetical protein